MQKQNTQFVPGFENSSKDFSKYYPFNKLNTSGDEPVGKVQTVNNTSGWTQAFL